MKGVVVGPADEDVGGAVIGTLVNKMGVCAGGRYVYPNMPPAPRVG